MDAVAEVSRAARPAPAVPGLVFGPTHEPRAPVILLRLDSQRVCPRLPAPAAEVFAPLAPLQSPLWLAVYAGGRGEACVVLHEWAGAGGRRADEVTRVCAGAAAADGGGHTVVVRPPAGAASVVVTAEGEYDLSGAARFAVGAGGRWASVAFAATTLAEAPPRGVGVLYVVLHDDVLARAVSAAAALPAGRLCAAVRSADAALGERLRCWLLDEPAVAAAPPPPTRPPPHAAPGPADAAKSPAPPRTPQGTPSEGAAQRRRPGGGPDHTWPPALAGVFDAALFARGASVEPIDGAADAVNTAYPHSLSVERMTISSKAYAEPSLEALVVAATELGARVVFAPADGRDFAVGIRPSDIVAIACHQGINRSQVCFLAVCGLQRAMAAASGAGPDDDATRHVLLPHGCESGFDPHVRFKDLTDGAGCASCCRARVGAHARLDVRARAQITGSSSRTRRTRRRSSTTTSRRGALRMPSGACARRGLGSRSCVSCGA